MPHVYNRACQRCTRPLRELRNVEGELERRAFSYRAVGWVRSNVGPISFSSTKYGPAVSAGRTTHPGTEAVDALAALAFAASDVVPAEALDVCPGEHPASSDAPAAPEHNERLTP
jgi:hypothetical protein